MKIASARDSSASDTSQTFFFKSERLLGAFAVSMARAAGLRTLPGWAAIPLWEAAPPGAALLNAARLAATGFDAALLEANGGFAPVNGSSARFGFTPSGPPSRRENRATGSVSSGVPPAPKQNTLTSSNIG